ncbi:hypothetical protein TNCV_2347391 [Trichonephila clavipes]|nr:hypothetical protein TNCV_2347391 [Trichonephila clavipes]
MPPFYQPQFIHPNSRAANREPTHLHSPTNHSAPYPPVNPELSLRTFSRQNQMESPPMTMTSLYYLT